MEVFYKSRRRAYFEFGRARVCVKVTSLAVFLVPLHNLFIHPRALVIDKVIQAGPGFV